MIDHRIIMPFPNCNDTQLYIAVEWNDIKGIFSLTNCLWAVNRWMNMNFVKLIEDTTEILLLNQQQNWYALEQPWESNSLDKSKVTSLSVILHSDPSLHISKVNKTPFFHLETFPGCVHFKLSMQDAEKWIHAFISSRIDCGNALLTGLPNRSLERLCSNLVHTKPMSRLPQDIRKASSIPLI